MTDETPTDDPAPPESERPNPAPPQSSSADPAAPVASGEKAKVPDNGPVLEVDGVNVVPEPHRILAGEDLALPGRQIGLPLILFTTTCVTTFWAGCKGWKPDFLFLEIGKIPDLVAENWQGGLTYMLAVMAILLAHEMGHFVQTVRYHIPASWPFFIPIVGIPTGTMGAVIGLDGSRANRKEMFDMGISGPLAGLVIAVPMGLYAIANTTSQRVAPGTVIFHDPLLFQYMIQWVHGELPANHELIATPLYMAAWVGMLVTGLNMLPIGQLDGGHVAYCMFGERAHGLARGLLLFAIAYMIISDNISWIIMVVLVIVIGTDHPPTHDDKAPMGRARYVIGIASLAIPILCFMPTPISLR